MYAVAGSSLVAYRLRKRLKLPAPVMTAWLFAAPLALARADPPSFRRDMSVWGAQMWAYKNAFELPADRPERHRRRVHIDYVRRLDTLIGLGMPPGQRLQRRLRSPHRLSKADRALSLFYMTWELEPHLVMAMIRRWRPDLFASAMGRLGATFDATLFGYWALPTAPPWWASEKAGRMDGQVHRVMKQVLRSIKGKRFPTFGDNESSDVNSFAGMPSDHFATAVMTALLLRDVDERLAAVGMAYALALGFALVYLGEHYVADLAAGLALTLAMSQAREPLTRLAERVLAA